MPYGLFAKQFLSVNYNLIVVFGIVCAVGGLISIIGDLGASAIKRNYDASRRAETAVATRAATRHWKVTGIWKRKILLRGRSRAG